MRLSPAIPVFRLLTLGKGDQIISGAFVATVTNLDNGTLTHINLSGQGKFDAATGVFVSTWGRFSSILVRFFTFTARSSSTPSEAARSSAAR